jgi:hypothetical protein
VVRCWRSTVASAGVSVCYRRHRQSVRTMSLGILAGSASLFVLTWLEWKHPYSQELDTRAAVHSALERFEPIDLAFRLTAAPRLRDSASRPRCRASAFLRIAALREGEIVGRHEGNGQACLGWRLAKDRGTAWPGAASRQSSTRLPSKRPP